MGGTRRDSEPRYDMPVTVIERPPFAARTRAPSPLARTPDVRPEILMPRRSSNSSSATEHEAHRGKLCPAHPRESNKLTRIESRTVPCRAQLTVVGDSSTGSYLTVRTVSTAPFASCGFAPYPTHSSQQLFEL